MENKGLSNNEWIRLYGHLFWTMGPNGELIPPADGSYDPVRASEAAKEEANILAAWKAVYALEMSARAKRLMDLYRLTPKEHEKILEYQGNVCAISKKPSTNYGTDHDHKTGLIRGRIDWRLNRGLAYFNDDPALLRAAADYLENPPATAALGAPRYGVIGKAKHKKKMVYGPPARGFAEQ